MKKMILLLLLSLAIRAFGDEDPIQRNLDRMNNLKQGHSVGPAVLMEGGSTGTRGGGDIVLMSLSELTSYLPSQEFTQLLIAYGQKIDPKVTYYSDITAFWQQMMTDGQMISHLSQLKNLVSGQTCQVAVPTSLVESTTGSMLSPSNAPLCWNVTLMMSNHTNTLEAVTRALIQVSIQYGASEEMQLGLADMIQIQEVGQELNPSSPLSGVLSSTPNFIDLTPLVQLKPGNQIKVTQDFWQISQPLFKNGKISSAASDLARGAGVECMAIGSFTNHKTYRLSSVSQNQGVVLTFDSGQSLNCSSSDGSIVTIGDFENAVDNFLSLEKRS